MPICKPHSLMISGHISPSRRRVGAAPEREEPRRLCSWSSPQSPTLSMLYQPDWSPAPLEQAGLRAQNWTRSKNIPFSAIISWKSFLLASLPIQMHLPYPFEILVGGPSQSALSNLVAMTTRGCWAFEKGLVEVEIGCVKYTPDSNTWDPPNRKKNGKYPYIF